MNEIISLLQNTSVGSKARIRYGAPDTQPDTAYTGNRLIKVLAGQQSRKELHSEATAGN